DHAGWQAPSGKNVSCCALLPSIFMRKICGRPTRSLTNAICPGPPPRGVGPSVGLFVGDMVKVGWATVAVGDGVMVGGLGGLAGAVAGSGEGGAGVVVGITTVTGAGGRVAVCAG